MVYRITFLYRSSTSGLEWSQTNYTSAASTAGAQALADTFNDAVMAASHANVQLVQCSIAGQTIGQPNFVFPASSFNTISGALGGVEPADGLALMIQGTGQLGNGGLSNWFMHGLAAAYIQPPNGVNATHAALAALQTAAAAYLRQYRPDVPTGSLLPIVDPPAAFLSVAIDTQLHLRRLGRGFLASGQTHRYRT